jgi:putative addiction module component (TIGR02574 family)
MNTLLDLPEADRMEIVERLQDSLFDVLQPAEEISEELKATLDRRWQEIESGQVECIPHETVMANLKAKHGLRKSSPILKLKRNFRKLSDGFRKEPFGPLMTSSTPTTNKSNRSANHQPAITSFIEIFVGPI